MIFYFLLWKILASFFFKKWIRLTCSCSAWARPSTSPRTLTGRHLRRTLARGGSRCPRPRRLPSIGTPNTWSCSGGSCWRSLSSWRSRGPEPCRSSRPCRGGRKILAIRSLVRENVFFSSKKVQEPKIWLLFAGTEILQAEKEFECSTEGKPWRLYKWKNTLPLLNGSNVFLGKKQTKIKKYFGHTF